MRAITQASFGGPDVLVGTEAPQPVPSSTEVLVRVVATSVNPVELYVRSGAYPMLGEPPFTLGWDVSGVVEAVTPGVNRFKVGDEVYGLPLFPRPVGANAEYIAAPSRQLAHKPKSLSHIEAAALPLVGLTVLQALVEVAAIEPGQRILIHGAGGGLGHIAVQLAKHLGATVIATASASKHDFLTGLGADQLIDYRRADFADEVKDIDVVFETVGGDYATRSLQVLRPDGLLVTAVEAASTTLPELAHAAGVRFAGVAVEPDLAGLETLAALADAGAIRPFIQQVFDLEDAAKAHELLAGGGTQGKIVLTP